jgi:hypothetical protein
MGSADLGISVCVPEFRNNDNVLGAVERALQANFPTAQIHVGLSKGACCTTVSDAGNDALLDQVDFIVGAVLDECVAC